VKWRAIHKIAREETTPSLSTALAIEAATGGEVTVRDLLAPAPVLDDDTHEAAE
jgi:hypothetical protein